MSRPLTEGEDQLARGVFGDAIDCRRVRIVGLDWGSTAFVVGSRMHFPHPPRDFSLQPLSRRAWFVHELAHVQQFQSAPLRTAWSWLAILLSGGYGRSRSGYRYAAPLRPWNACNIEQQASMVEHAYVLREAGACAGAPSGLTLADYRACVPFPESSSAGS